MQPSYAMAQVLERNKPKNYRESAISLAKTLAATAIDRDRRSELPHEEVRLLREAGLLPIVVPQTCGGGANWIEALKVVQALSKAERGEVAIAVYAAKAFATKAGLDLTSRIFEGMGACSTAAKYGFDRYWRDLRTFTLHDPLDYKLRDVGNWVLNAELPIVTQYS